MTGKPIASVSMDLDDQWTYLKTHGDPEWNQYPSYLNYALPRILDFLDEKNTRITFFIVAQDAVFKHNHDVLAEIPLRGHDIGNHTFHHDPWLHIYSELEINEEISRAEEHIEKVTGIRPRGFRGPGFSFSDTVLRVLVKRRYNYDASTFPNILNPLARMYFLWKSNMSKEERKQRQGLFGSWKDGLRPVKPYEWESDNMKMLEIPVTTMPLFKIPIHASYVLYLSTYSVSLGLAYFRFAMRMCRIYQVSPSILLHPLDFIGEDDTQALSFFPAMRMDSGKKIEVMHAMLDELSSSYRIVTMAEHSDQVRQCEHLKKRTLEPIVSAAEQ